ncbi:hypothetical protein [Tateyamaria omphalii]|uniref:Uncharacterized protein n=1 Tax=Tateyamaria omphalii TaxID=299262 RepID=A0A1P8MZX6_9RHOB|nr:hypothetical protein [Tateyamaria omphalii]APX13459.1 hypothetical protein BWR18_18580 [Tateyamaria omphalii]
MYFVKSILRSLAQNVVLVPFELNKNSVHRRLATFYAMLVTDVPRALNIGLPGNRREILDRPTKCLESAILIMRSKPTVKNRFRDMGRNAARNASQLQCDAALAKAENLRSVLSRLVTIQVRQKKAWSFCEEIPT